ncbi:thioredoxin [bacterium (Candidatus Howlettbacteria) CG_4_10_14_0_8_um_filter_40_9]|nr:MAG: thioredoxin [bacterium (Candidatus Howlettbacteria) CG_4_10_14_0_8_um_filter_40_9]
MSVRELTDKDFTEAEKSDKAIAKFHADWCGPCQMLKPTYLEVAEKVKGVDFFSINVDNAPETSEKYGVMSVPTMIIFEKGKEKDRIVGALNAETLEGEIKKKFGA